MQPELDEIQKLKFRFSCMGLNCLVWSILLLAAGAMYLLLKK
jgi:hypothetical protein